MSFRLLGLTHFFRPNILKTKNPASINRQDMELLMTESHMRLQDIKSSPSLTCQNNNRCMSSIRLNLLTKTTRKKDLSQLEHPNGLYPVWVFWCFLRLSEREKYLVRIMQANVSYVAFLSPVCILGCLFRWLDWEKDLIQWEQEKVFFLPNGYSGVSSGYQNLRNTFHTWCRQISLLDV